MSTLHPLSVSVRGICVSHCPPELEAQVEALFAEALTCAEGGRVAVEEVDGTDVLCLFLDERTVRPIVSGLTALGLLTEHADLTPALLRGRSCGAVYDAALVRHRHLVDAFRRQHLTVNDVLDKIGALGIGSLDAVDREVLRSATPGSA